MIHPSALSRRAFLAAAAASPFAAGTASAARPEKVPVGLELYSVRNQLKEDLMGTVRAVAKLGYEGVEFYSPYMEWTPDYAKQVRRLLDDLKIRCFSTHNSRKAFAPDQMERIAELNTILGSKMIIMASAGKIPALDGWIEVAEDLNRGADKWKSAGLAAGFHNHQVEFTELEGKMPIDVLAQNTNKDVVLQLDVGTCLEAKADPVAWINDHPGRIRSMHLKDWSPEPGKGYEVLFGEGKAPWKQILAAAEKTGGIEYYLVEQEGSRYAPIDTAERCLAEFRKLRPA